MPKLSSYTNTTPVATDRIPFTDVSDTNATKNMLVSALATLLHAGATFTGDTTFDTDTLFVDSTNDRVGVGTTSPVSDVHVDASDTSSVLTLTNSATGSTSGDGCIVATDSLNLDIYNREAGYIRFGTSGSERMRILASGGLTFNGDTAAANALDDYEEGTFTPAYSNIGTGTYTKQVGTYTKIGDTVTCWMHLKLATLGTASGNLRISGLPFTSNALADIFGSSSTMYGSGWTTGRASLVGQISPSATEVFIYYGSAATSITQPSHADASTGSLILSVTYKV